MDKAIDFTEASEELWNEYHRTYPSINDALFENLKGGKIVLTEDITQSKMTTLYERARKLGLVMHSKKVVINGKSGRLLRATPKGA